MEHRIKSSQRPEERVVWVPGRGKPKTRDSFSSSNSVNVWVAARNLKLKPRHVHITLVKDVICKLLFLLYDQKVIASFHEFPPLGKRLKNR